MPTNLDSPERRVQHAKALVKDLRAYTVTGLRLSHADNPEEGRVVTFDEKEAKAVVAAVKEVLDARQKAARA